MTSPTKRAPVGPHRPERPSRRRCRRRNRRPADALARASSSGRRSSRDPPVGTERSLGRGSQGSSQSRHLVLTSCHASKSSSRRGRSLTLRPTSSVETPGAVNSVMPPRATGQDSSRPYRGRSRPPPRTIAWWIPASSGNPHGRRCALSCLGMSRRDSLAPHRRARARRRPSSLSSGCAAAARPPSPQRSLRSDSPFPTRTISSVDARQRGRALREPRRCSTSATTSSAASGAAGTIRPPLPTDPASSDELAPLVDASSGRPSGRPFARSATSPFAGRTRAPTLLLPFWRQAIDRPLAAVLCVRHPLEVARSLEAPRRRRAARRPRPVGALPTPAPSDGLHGPSGVRVGVRRRPRRRGELATPR